MITLNTKIKFKLNYILLTWCLVGCNKLTRSAVRLGFRLVNRRLLFLMLSSLTVWTAADSFIHLNYLIMSNKSVKSNIVYDSFNDVTWDFSGFFEKLADYYNGNVQEMSEQLIDCIETLMHMQNDAILDPMVKNSALNLLTVREILIEVKPNTN